MKILNVFDYTHKLNEMSIFKKIAQKINDFFEMLFKIVDRKGTFVYLYYGNDWAQYMNKTIVLNGIKQLNPMRGRIFKISACRFQAGKDYYERLEQLVPGYTLDPNSPMNQEHKRKNPWKPLPDNGKPCQENINNGEIALPVVEPKTIWSKWIMIDDKGTPVEVEYEDVLPYIGAPKPDTGEFKLDFKRYYVNKIYRLNGAGYTFTNEDFIYPILVQFFKK